MPQRRLRLNLGAVAAPDIHQTTNPTAFREVAKYRSSATTPRKVEFWSFGVYDGIEKSLYLPGESPIKGKGAVGLPEICAEVNILNIKVTEILRGFLETAAGLGNV